MRRTLSTMLLVPVLAVALATPARGQSAGLPRTYSFLATTSLMSPEMQVKVNRNGARELVELTIPGKPGQGSELHQRLLYDFGAHRVYATDLVARSCTVQEYTSPYAPMFDPIGGSEEMLAELARTPPPVAGRATINGIATRIIDAPLAEGQGRTRVWLDEKHGFMVRMAVGLGSEPLKVRVEMRQLSYAPSPAALFVPPTGCTPVGGTSNAQGGTAVMSVNADVSVQGQQLEVSPANESRPEAPAVPAATALPAERGQVTSVSLRLVPDRYRGPCPGKVQLVGEFTTDGPGTVWYQFLAGAVSSSPEGKLIFKSAGTQTVTVQGTYHSTPQVKEALLLAAMENERGEHGPETVSSEPFGYDFVCTGR